jgi:hypothetical protein
MVGTNTGRASGGFGQCRCLPARHKRLSLMPWENRVYGLAPAGRGEVPNWRFPHFPDLGGASSVIGEKDLFLYTFVQSANPPLIRQAFTAESRKRGNVGGGLIRHRHFSYRVAD